ncbi:hypothetical protein JHD46_07675 [Sulfurimonas sp. SAG-AH-194-C20]|nr:hypothetical protein [Sulfurimonas sp. SAG-AH-194-C20]MDF1879512.1 hypothetical protein [Sulfurimonas sp. SAG-AH-194-C20]
MILQSKNIKEGTKIEYSSKELLFLASSGQPYRGSLYVKFTSQGETLDLVSFKKYITSLRDKTLNAEDIAYEIYESIKSVIKVDDLGIIVDLSARGGLQQRLCFGQEFTPVIKNNIFQI